MIEVKSYGEYYGKEDDQNVIGEYQEAFILPDERAPFAKSILKNILLPARLKTKGNGFMRVRTVSIEDEKKASPKSVTALTKPKDIDSLSVDKLLEVAVANGIEPDVRDGIRVVQIRKQLKEKLGTKETKKD